MVPTLFAHFHANGSSHYEKSKDVTAALNYSISLSNPSKGMVIAQEMIKTPPNMGLIVELVASYDMLIEKLKKVKALIEFHPSKGDR
jgi:hypothetical protein